MSKAGPCRALARQGPAPCAVASRRPLPDRVRVPGPGPECGPKGNRTPTSGLKGPRLNHSTMGPRPSPSDPLPSALYRPSPGPTRKGLREGCRRAGAFARDPGCRATTAPSRASPSRRGTKPWTATPRTNPWAAVPPTRPWAAAPGRLAAAGSKQADEPQPDPGCPPSAARPQAGCAATGCGKGHGLSDRHPGLSGRTFAGATGWWTRAVDARCSEPVRRHQYRTNSRAVRSAVSHREAGRAPTGPGTGPLPGSAPDLRRGHRRHRLPRRTAIAGTRSSKHPMKEPIVGIGSDGSPNRDPHRTSGGPGGEGPCRTPRPSPITRSSRSRRARTPGAWWDSNPQPTPYEGAALTVELQARAGNGADRAAAGEAMAGAPSPLVPRRARSSR